MIMTAAPYPSHLIEAVVLADGSRVIVRPPLPQDAILQRRFFRALPAEARYFRFMTELAEPSEEMVRRLAEVDHQRHVALLACIFDGSSETVVGEARYIIEPGEATVAEFALAVARGWQRIGLARALLGRLIAQAQRAGIRDLVGDTLPDNRAMLALAHASGFTVTRKAEDRRMLRLRKELRRARARPSATYAGGLAVLV